MIKSKTDSFFDDIRPIRDDEVVATINDLLDNYYFKRAVEPFIKPMKWADLEYGMRASKTIYEFQTNVIYPVFAKLFKDTTIGVKGFNWEEITKNKNSHLYISNHRDIILDATLLNMGMMDYKLPTTEVAIGDNLLIYPWISNVMRLNNSFIVKRGSTIREKLNDAKHLSEYIHWIITERNASAWIAQREGRAKDSNDMTQVSVLKMLTLAGGADVRQSLKSLNIIPLSLSYERDPCDYLKAMEQQLKRDNPEYKKTFMNDLESMITGLIGFKGHVYYKFGACINSKLDKVDPSLNRADFLQKAAEIIDNEIYRNYLFFPFNYIAYDMMNGTAIFKHHYYPKDVKRFEKYLEGQIDRIDMKKRDVRFLKDYIVKIYGNPITNYLKAVPEPTKKKK